MRFLMFCWVVSLASGQVIVNGSFEGPGLGGTLNLAGAFSLPGWSGLGPSNGGNAGLVVGVDNGLAPAAGGQHFNFNGGNPGDRGWIEQVLATVGGTQYAVSFAVGRAGGGQELGLVASAGGVSLAAAPPGSRGYADYSFTFVAAGAATVLRFADVSGGNSISDLYLDNVRVEAVTSAIPEPSTYAAVMGLAALVVVAAKRHKKPQK